jgi:hypothetical protein
MQEATTACQRAEGQHAVKVFSVLMQNSAAEMQSPLEQARLFVQYYHELHHHLPENLMPKHGSLK